MELKNNKRSTEWLRKGVPGKIESISLLISGESIETLYPDYRNTQTHLVLKKHQ